MAVVRKEKSLSPSIRSSSWLAATSLQRRFGRLPAPGAGASTTPRCRTGAAPSRPRPHIPTTSPDMPRPLTPRVLPTPSRRAERCREMARCHGVSAPATPPGPTAGYATCSQDLVSRAVAAGELEGAAAGLEALDAEALADYQPYHAARADLLARVGRDDEAFGAYGRALELSENLAERRFLERQRALVES